MSIRRGARLGFSRYKNLYVPAAVAGGGGGNGVAPYYTQITDAAPKAFWHMHTDPAPASEPDESAVGGTQNLNINATPTYDADTPFTNGEGSYDLDINDGYISPDTSQYVNSNFSISAWVKLDTLANNATIMANGGIGTTGSPFIFYIDTNNSLRLVLHQNGSSSAYYTAASANSVVPVGTWAHVGCTYDGTGNVGKVFLSGNNVTSSQVGPTGTRDTSGASFVAVGRSQSTGASTDGHITGVAYFDILVTDEVMEDFGQATRET